MGHSEKTRLAVREFLIGSAIRRVTGNRIHEAAVSFAFASSFITSSFQRQIRPTCQLTCVMSNYIVWRPWENVSKTTLRFMCAVKSDRPIDRRTLASGCQCWMRRYAAFSNDTSDPRIPMALSSVDPAAFVSVAAHATIVKNTTRRRAIS